MLPISVSGSADARLGGGDRGGTHRVLNSLELFGQQEIDRLNLVGVGCRVVVDDQRAVAFAQPDGCHIDQRGVVWIQTDSSAQNMASADWANIGNNQMLAADPATGEVRRFLTGPVGCEITAVQFTPDMRTMFVNIQHPSTSNASPYNRSYTLALWGYEGVTGLVFDAPTFEASKHLQVKVNAASRLAYFDRVADVDLLNAAGRRLERHKGVRTLDIQHLTAGTYYLRFKGGASHQLILQ